MSKKLIEVALPLEAINVASAREKSIRHGHPSTLHLWWARRPLAAARAVIFAQMVDDPSGHPELFPDEVAQQAERERLFAILEKLVTWENTTNEEVLQAARDEIWTSWRRTCAANRDHPRAAELFNPDKLPGFHDPFAGGGALPLEAQRLGLESYASDLNPVAVLINKAMIEIPPKFAGMPPINPEARKDNTLLERNWQGAQGLAEDVRYYGQWMRDEAEKRIGHLYPKVKVTKEMAKTRPDLEKYVGQELTVIAWLWARTVKSPNPAFSHVDVPLISSFMLSTKKGKEVYIEPIVEGDNYRFEVKMGKPADMEAAKNGTKLSRGAHFRCLMSDTPMEPNYIKAEGKAGRMSSRLIAIVAEGERGRVYFSPLPEHEAIARKASPDWEPEPAIAPDKRSMFTPLYGMTHFRHLFTPRQLVALTTFSDLVSEAVERVQVDARAAGLADDGIASSEYAKVVGLYLSIALSRLSDILNSLCQWETSKTQVRHLFTKQAIPMLWDFAENNVLSTAAGSYLISLGSMNKTFTKLPMSPIAGKAQQWPAQKQKISEGRVVSTDPPYYDNIGYADLSDFFYVWLRRSLRSVFPELFATVSVPKEEELVATPYRHGNKEKAEKFFLEGMTQAMHQLVEQSHPAFPVTIYYAFKQSERKSEDGIFSTGWETFLAAVMEAGFAITGTIPIRSELSNRMISSGKNALASSIVLVCQKRSVDAPTATRRDFVNALRDEMPVAVQRMQAGNIAPVDLAQAAIGPGMAVYTRYSSVLDSSGEALSVRDALILINQTLDEVLAEQEGDFDADTRWALAWFEQHGFAEGEYGTAETLSTAKNTSISGLVEAGILTSKAGKVRLLSPEELADNWNPDKDDRVPVWEIVHQLVKALGQGEEAAATLIAQLGSRAETARELAYRLYTMCERKKRANEALAYNGLVQAWSSLAQQARERRPQTAVQESVFSKG